MMKLDNKFQKVLSIIAGISVLLFITYHSQQIFGKTLQEIKVLLFCH